MTQGVLLVSHGTVDDLDDLESFVTRVRRGRPPSPELISELRRRYLAIGGRSPLNSINGVLASKLGRRLGIPVAWASRLAPPFVRDVLVGLVDRGIQQVAVVPLAQHSAAVYAAGARASADGLSVELACAGNWGREPRLSEAFARRIAAALRGDDAAEPSALLLTAHSLPLSVISAGDAYEEEMRASARDVVASLGEKAADLPVLLAFQSQGLASEAPGGWLGPDIAQALDELHARGGRRVVVAPIGFLADHVEILYDLDIEARRLAADRGMIYVRSASLNSDDDLVEVLAEVAVRTLAHTG
jgi:ferrochelatase